MTEVLSVPELDPLGDEEAVTAQKTSKNRARVGSARPSSLIYTYGPGAVMDLPQFTVMPAGLDDWERIWARRSGVPQIHAPRLLDAVRTFLGPGVAELRPFPWAPKRSWADTAGSDLGVPARVFPQWMRCPGCDMLGLVTQFEYTNTNPYRPDQAQFQHTKCPGHTGRPRKVRKSTTVPARFLLVCEDGHADEFPYDWWVHEGQRCPAGVQFASLAMLERTVGKGASATIECRSCGAKRPMNEAQGEAGRQKLPRCRGRHPHLGIFAKDGCAKETRVMLLGASNLWFPATQSIVVMPGKEPPTPASRGREIVEAIGQKKFDKYHRDLDRIREELDDADSPLVALSDEDLSGAIAAAVEEPDERERAEAIESFDPTTLLVPEWTYLNNDLISDRVEDEDSGLVLSRPTGEVHPDLRARGIVRVHAVDKLRKVNALVGFTRIDEMERAADLAHRLVPLTRRKRPTWTVATEDRGEGLFLQLDEQRLAEWESRIGSSSLWEAHRAAHERNFNARFSESARHVDPSTRLKPPRYWLLHTLAHVLIREMAMYSGYSAASISERIYAWQEEEGRPAAAGVLIITTASDSDGTLGGLVQLSRPHELNRIFDQALRRATRCSSDPVCAQRTPKDPEDFLHGAACHTCAMASETSCERANRFLDRRFLIDLPGAAGYGFFG